MLTFMQHTNPKMPVLPPDHIPTILIVDDDRDDHDFLNMAISEVMPGTRVVSVYDGGQAMEYLESLKTERGRLPDLVFLDINMHKVDGRATVRQIRKDAFFDQLPVIILSTSKSNKDETELMAMGANGFYAKQLRIKDLETMLAEVNARFLLSTSH